MFEVVVTGNYFPVWRIDCRTCNCFAKERISL